MKASAQRWKKCGSRVPQHALRTTPHAYRQRRIVKPRMHSQLSLAVSSRRTSTRTQQATLELIKDVCTQLLRGNSKSLGVRP